MYPFPNGPAPDCRSKLLCARRHKRRNFVEALARLIPALTLAALAALAPSACTTFDGKNRFVGREIGDVRRDH